MDRPVGNLTVNSNGFASYQFPISVPPGAGNGNEPTLSLNFSHGIATNDILGSKWSLGGVSSIILIPLSNAVDNGTFPSNGQTNYRYSLDAQELLCTNGTYGSSDSTYMKEVEDGNLTIATYKSDDSFLVTNQFGCRWMYGLTQESRIQAQSTDGKTMTVEWKLSRAYDNRGNYVQYVYEHPSPNANVDSRADIDDAGVTYLSYVQYTCNDNINYTGRMKVGFRYEPRPDVVRATTWGRLTKIAHLLTQIITTVGSADGTRDYLARTYTLKYTRSEATGDSLLTSITEKGNSDTELTPTRFEYSGTAPETWKDSLFLHPPNYLTELPNTSGIRSIVPVNMTGRAYTDLACLHYDASLKRMDLITFIGDPTSDTAGSNSVMKWTHDASVPSYPLAKEINADQNSLMVADVDNDGRTDLILAFNSSDELQFNVAKSSGKGYQAPLSIFTRQPWEGSNRFFAIDVTGNQRTDIVQVQTMDDGTTKINAFFDIIAHLGGSQSPVSSATWKDSPKTIDWFPIQHQRSNTTFLVQVMESVTLNDSGETEINAKFFSTGEQPFAQNPFKLAGKIKLATYKPNQVPNVTVLAIDINGDGVSDLVLCSSFYTRSRNQWYLKLAFTTFLFDGESSFTPQEVMTYDEVASGTGSTPTQGSFYVLNLDKSRYPCVTFIHQEENHNWTSLYGMGSGSGLVRKPSASLIADSSNKTPFGTAWTVAPMDLNGIGKAGLMLQYMDKQNSCYISPVYNTIGLSDFLTATTSPLGLRQEISYAPLSQLDLYDTGPGVDWRSYSPSNADEDVFILGNSAYVVNEIRTLNDSSLNAFAVAGSTKGLTGRCQRYSYGAAKMNRKGRGYLGFGSFTELDVDAGVKLVSTLSTSWPTVGKLLQHDVYGSSHSDLLKRIDEWPPTTNGNDIDNLQLLQSTVHQYEAIQLISGSDEAVKVTNLNKAPVQLVRQTMTGTTFVQSKDAQGNPRYMFGTKYTYMTNSNQTLSEYTFSCDEETGDIATELWKYTKPGPTVNGVQILPYGRKETASKSQSPQFENYVAGDLSLIKYDYDEKSGTLLTSSLWSSDSSQFEITMHQFDDFGNETVKKDPAGLITTTTFDPIYHTFPVKKEYKGPSLHLVEYYAYDPRYGTRFMYQSTYGDVEVATTDVFGRPSQLWRTPADRIDGSNIRDTIELPGCLVMDENLRLNWSDNLVCLNQELSYASIVSKNKSTFLSKSRTLYNDPSTSSADPAMELIDSEGRIRKVKSQADGLAPVAWQYREYSIAGSQILESYATIPAANEDGTDWLPDYQVCNIAILDALERPVLNITPPSSPGNSFTSQETTHTLGNTLKSMSIRESEDFGYNTGDPIIELLQYKFTQYDQQVRLLSQTTNSGRVQKYEYDALGRITMTTDPSGRVDVRSYNSIGKLSSANNIYNNPSASAFSHDDTPSVVGERNTWDAMGRMLTQTNAMNQVANILYDAKGRICHRIDADSRVTTYTYDDPAVGADKLAYVKIALKAPGQPAQDELGYQFSYDATGRISSQTLTMTNGQGGTFKTLFYYDRQGHLLKKVLPDSSYLSYTWKGDHLANVTLKSPEGEQWDVSAGYTDFNADGLAQSWALTAHDQLTAGLSGSISYDLQRRPVVRTFGTSSADDAMVSYQLSFDGLGRIHSQKEAISGDSTTYEYEDQRLKNSLNSFYGNASYEYDNSGNITTKAGQSITYSSWPAGLGTASVKTQNANGTFSCSYDAAGRVIARQVPGGRPVNLTYDGYGKMRSYSMDGADATTLFSDHTGQTVAKISGSNSMEIYCGRDFSILIAPDGTKLIRRNMFDASLQHIIATVTSKYPDQSKMAAGIQLDAYMTNHKGTVTHVFDGIGSLRRKYTYDDYGSLRSTTTGSAPGTLVTEKTDAQPSIESNLQDIFTGLVDFTGRWYDPYIGRFTTPDITLQPKYIQQPDGANLLAFECNDPINRVDPSGHWNWNLFGAIVIGVALIAVSFVIPFSGILGAAVTGALFGAGSASITYGLKNKNKDAKTFWKGWGVDVAIGAATGAATGAAGEWISSAKCLDSMMGVSSEAYNAVKEGEMEAKLFTKRWLVTVGGKALLSGVSSVAQEAADTEAENAVWGTHQSLSWQQLLRTGIESTLEAGAIEGLQGEFNASDVGQSFKNETLPAVKNDISWHWNNRPMAFDGEGDGFKFTSGLKTHSGMRFL